MVRIQKKCLMATNIKRLPFTGFSIPVQNCLQQYRCFWKLKCTHGVLSSMKQKSKRFCECWMVCLKVISAKLYLYLKDNKSKSLQSCYILLFKYWFLHESKHTYFWCDSLETFLLPRQHWLCTFRKVIENELILFASKVSHRKLNVLIFHTQVCLLFGIVPKPENTSLVVYFSQKFLDVCY